MSIASERKTLGKVIRENGFESVKNKQCTLGAR